MAVFLLANKDSDKTTVSVEEIRQFVEDVASINELIKNANTELKSALTDDDKVEELKEGVKTARSVLKTYVDSHTVYKAYSDKLTQLKADKRDLISDGKTNGIPKKEIDLAIKALKQDIDMTESTEIYSNIADLVD